MSPLVRQWTLLRTLYARPGTVRELAQELGVGTRTIRRDLGTFRKAGFALQERVGERGCKWWRIKALLGGRRPTHQGRWGR